MVPSSPAAEIFVVDWTAPWSSVHEVDSAHRALLEAAARLTTRGTEMRCLQSTFLPARNKWLCFVGAPDGSAAATAAGLAQIPQRFIHRGIDLSVPSEKRPEVLPRRQALS